MERRGDTLIRGIVDTARALAATPDELQNFLTEVVAGAAYVAGQNGLPMEQVTRQGLLMASMKGAS